jgi:hypothetical protein
VADAGGVDGWLVLPWKGIGSTVGSPEAPPFQTLRTGEKASPHGSPCRGGSAVYHGAYAVERYLLKKYFFKRL